MSLVFKNVLQKMLSCSFFSRRFFGRVADLSSGMDATHATRLVCRAAEKTAGKKTTQQKKKCVTFMKTRDMYLHFNHRNICANGNTILVAG